MASNSIDVVGDKKIETGSRSLDPFKNPSYPKRVHVLERAQFEESLRSCDVRIGAIRVKLNSLGSHANRASYERLYHQMLGAETRSRRRHAECRWKQAGCITRIRNVSARLPRLSSVFSRSGTR